MPQVSIANVNAVVARLADEVSVAAAQAIARRGFFSIAVAGGSATQSFPTLAHLPVSWSNVHFSGPMSGRSGVRPESNFGLADRLADARGVPESSVHRMPADAPDSPRLQTSTRPSHAGPRRRSR
jgi:6-phosphogluconolactonase/glucosamine-6-phosphate isomerase/deaminase